MAGTGTSTAQRLTARVEIEHVPHRSAAWRALWRELFDVIEAEFAASDVALDTDNDARCFAAGEEQP